MMNAKNSAAQNVRKVTEGTHATRRKRWLGSGSILAAAIAMTATLSDPAAAQSGPVMSSRVTMDQPMARSAPATVQQLNALANRPNAGQPPVQTRTLPTPIATERMMIERGVTLSAPALPQAESAPPSQPAELNIQPTGIASASGPVTAASSTPATLPGDTNTTGINVLAEANYFAGEVDFIPGAAVDIVNIFVNEAIINWTTNAAGSVGNTVDFLPAGGNLLFTSDLSNYTVLNRIFTPGLDSAIRIDGNITSNALSGSRGGNIWFYSPGGIIVGSTATFDIGSLILTSSELSAITGIVDFAGVAEPNTAVIIEGGASIDALNDVLILAPRIEQGGTVRAGDKIGYVGAEEARVTFAEGLFEVLVTVGTSDENGIVHTGSSGGPTLVDDQNRGISFFVQGQDAAVNMLVGGNIGYDDASVATASNGVIFLEAGDGSVANSGNITLGAGNYNSDLFVGATGAISIAADGQGSDINFGSIDQNVNVSAFAEQQISIAATSGANIAANGNFSATAGDGPNGGIINLTVDDAGRDDAVSISGLIVEGDLRLRVDANGINDTAPTGVGGDAVGGTININVSQGGELISGAELELFAGAQAGYGGFQAGSATAGTINLTLDGQNSSIEAATFISLTATADAAEDPFGSFSPVPPQIGSDSLGGTANLNLNGGLISAPSLGIVVDAVATAGSQGAATPPNDATGGTVTINNAANLDLQFLGVSTDAAGAAGGRGNFFEDGSVGGTGTGGTIILNSTVDIPNVIDLFLTARGTGGDGGEGGFSGAGGAGGAGQGGDITFTIGGAGALLGNAADVFIDTGAAGGAGGVGGTEASLTDSGDGGAGGTATGGTSAFIIAGTGATFTYNSDEFALRSDAIGGAGGAGAFNFSGLSAGTGGAGGDGTGGTVSVEAQTGATLDLTGFSGFFSLFASGNGGTGGVGGGIDMGSGGIAGNGGAGGSGVGGSPLLIAAGGTISSPDLINLSAGGSGGTGGIGGDDGLTVIGAQGNGGSGVGGTPSILTFDGSPGIISLGDVSIDASAFGGAGTVTGTTTGGQISIIDGSADPAGLITMASLFVTTSGVAAPASGPSLIIESDSGPITVTGNVSADVTGDIAFNFDGDGQFVVGNNADLIAGGDITAAHLNNASGVISISVGNDFTASAGGDFAAGDATIIDATREVSITAQNIAFDRIVAGNDNIFDAGEFALTLNATNGSITSGSIGSLTSLSGVDLDATQAINVGDILVNDGQILIDAGTTLNAGTVRVTQGGGVSVESVVINSGGDMVLGDTRAQDNLTITSGGSLTTGSLTGVGVVATATGAVDVGDVSNFSGVANGQNIVISGASIAIDSAVANTSAGNAVTLTATSGDITIGTVDANGSLTVDAPGNVNFGDLAALGVFITSGANVTGTFASSDRAINSGSPRDVQITATGDVSVSSFSTVNDVEITAASFATDAITTGFNINGVASDVIIDVAGLTDIGQADIQGDLIVTAAEILLGTIGVAGTTDLVSTVGDIGITDLTTDQDILISSAAAANIGSLAKRGTDTIGNETFNVSAVTDIVVSGSIDGHDNIVLNAGGLIDAAQLIAFDNVTATAGTSIDIAAITTTDTGDVSLTGPTISLGNSTIDGTLTANAAGGNLTIGDVTTTGAIDLDATGIVSFGVITTGGSINANGGSGILGGSALKTGTDSLGNESMTFISGGDITLSGTIDTHDNIVIDAGGTVDANLLQAFDNITVTTTGLIDIADMVTTNTGNVILTGGSVIVTDATVNGSFAATSTIGAIAFNGTVSPDNGLSANSATDITFATLDITNGLLELIAAGDISGVNAINSAPAGSGGSDSTVLTAGGNITLTGIAQSVDDSVTLNAGGNLTVAAIDAADTLSAIATGAVQVGTATTANSGSVSTFRGTSVALDNGQLAGFLVLDATAGNVDSIGVISSGNQTSVDATGVVSLNSLTANGLTNITAGSGVDSGDISVTSGSLTITATGGNTVVNDVSSAGNLNLNITGNLTTGALSSNSVSPGLSVTVSGDADIGSATSNVSSLALLDINVGGALSGGDFTGGGVTTLDATSINVGAVESVNAQITLTSSVGEITTGDLTSGLTTAVNSATTATLGNVLAGASFSLTTPGDAQMGDLDANASANFDIGGNLIAGNLIARATSPGFDMTVGGNATVGSIVSNGLLLVDVAGDLIGTDFTGAALTDISGASVTLNSLTNGNITSIASTIGNVTIEALDISSNLTITAAAISDIGDVITTGSATIGGASVILDTGDVTNTLTLNAASGDIAGTGAIAVGGLIDLDAAGNIGFGSLDAGAAFTANAGGDIAFNSASAVSTLTFVAGADIIFSALSGDNTVSLDAAGAIVGGDVTTDQLTSSSSFTAGTSVTLGDVTTRILTVNAGTDITLGAVDALGRDIRGIAIDLTAAGNVDFASLTSGRGIDIGSATISGGDIVSDNGVTIAAEVLDLGNVSVTELGPVTIESTAGDLSIGNVESNTFGISLTSAAALTAGDLTVNGTANSSDITVTSLGNATIGDATAGNQLSLDVTGNLVAGNLVSNVISPGTVVTVGGDAAIASFDALLGPATFTIGGALSGGTLASDGVLTLNAASIDVAGAISRTQSVIAAATTGDATIGNAQANFDISVTANNGTPTLGSFTAGDDISLTGSSVTLGAGNIVGNLTLTSLNADVTLLLDGAESITVGGQTILDAAGDIVVTHTNNAAGTLSLDVIGNINALANGSIDASAGSILSGFEVFLLASGSIGVDDVRAIPGIIIEGGGSVTVNNASATGPQGVSNIRGISISAGRDPFAASVLSFDNFADATITGTVDSYGDVAVRAGGAAIFATGSATRANDRIFVETGDDIIVETGATLTSAINPLFAPDPSLPFNGAGAIELNAGGVIDLLSVPATPIASLVIDGTLNANTGAVIASANAIDGLDGMIMASSIALDINDAPGAGGFQDNDAGLLSASCLEGNICLGNIMADNVIEIGQNSNNNVIQLIIQQGAVNANDIRITTRNDIVMGTDGIATTLNASNSFRVRSLIGDIDLRDAAITSNEIAIDAAGSLLGSAILSSTADVGITVGQDLNAAQIFTGGQLTEVDTIGGDLESFFDVPGSIDVGLLSVGSGDVNITAGNIARIGSLIVPASDVSISAGILAQLDLTDSANNVALDGGAVVLGDITAANNVSVVSSSTADFTSVNAGNDIDILAAASANGGDLTAFGAVQVDAQLIALGAVDADTIDLSSAGDILFDSLLSPSGITLAATGGTIGANTGPGDIDSGGAVSLSAQTISIGNIDASGGVNAITSAGALSVGDITNTAIGSQISLVAGGAAGDLSAGILTTNRGDILLNGGRDVALVSAANSTGIPTAGSIAILAGGDVTVAGTLNAGEDVAIRSIGSTSLAAVFAGDDIAVDAGGDIALVEAATSGAGIDLFALSFNDANAGQPGSIAFAAETLTGSNINLASGADVVATGTLNAANAITVSAAGTPVIGNAISAGDTSVSGSSINFNNGSVGGDLTLTANAGDIDGSGMVSVAGGIALDASGGIGFGTLVSQNGDFTASSGGDIIFDAIDSSQSVALQAGGRINGDRIDAVTAINLGAAGSIFIDHAETDADFTAIAGGNVTTGLNSIITGGNIFIVGDVVDLGNSTAGGFIDVIGSQIDFVNLIAGSTVTLLTTLSSPVGIPGTGNLNITGTNITAGTGPSSLEAAGSISVSGATDILGSLSMDASGDIAFGTADVQGGDFTATAGGAIDLVSADAGGNIDFFAGLALTATGDIAGASGVSLESSDGSVTGANIVSGGDVDIRAATTATFSDISVDASQVTIVAGSNVTLNDILAANEINITSGGTLIFNDLQSAFSVILDSQQATLGQTIDAGSVITIDAGAGGVSIGDASAGTAMTITATDQIDAGTLTAASDILLQSIEGGDITASTIAGGADVRIFTGGSATVAALNAAQGGAGGDILVQADSGITIQTLTGVTATLEASGGDVAVTDDAALTGLVSADGQSVLLRSNGDLAAAANATAGDITIEVSGDLTTEGIFADGDIFLQSGGSTTLNASASSGTPGAGLPSGVQGVQQITTINGGDITITAAADILINSLVDAAGTLSMTADNLIQIDAVAVGNVIETLSADIAIGTGGALGQSDRTTEISIATLGDIQLGGAAGTSMGFELDNDEFSRVHSGGDLIIAAIGVTTGDGNINIGDLDVQVAQGTGTLNDGNIANFGGLLLEADNDVNLTGGLIVTGATPDNFLAIDALNLITIDAETATLQVADGNGAPAGSIGLSANAIIAAGSADIADIPGLSFADAEALLALAPAIARPDGYIIGSDITFNVDSGVFIANSGAGTGFDDRRGIVANTLTVSSMNPDVGIVINGVIDTATGIDAVGLVGVPGTFDQLSTINGCLLIDPASCVAVISPPIDSIGPEGGPIRDLIDDQVEKESPVVETVSTILVEMREDPEQQQDPLLDEPVTGAGNEDFWFGEEEQQTEDEEELEPAE
ncbi:hypothetical protein FGU71_10405 [Erythrobacter insulae]|uniref:Autotransporter domain-containing protein n=1 Tax=Erythrobacter insulae TaxID=2584124 RepID=A0A547PDL6_9SPHN|nr:hypothetical protein [Erythrobacter insulae]TRD12232.1 hypothetical protein FGU71_10405 [Erythrobacter insulae]